MELKLKNALLRSFLGLNDLVKIKTDKFYFTGAKDSFTLLSHKGIGDIRPWKNKCSLKNHYEKLFLIPYFLFIVLIHVDFRNE